MNTSKLRGPLCALASAVLLSFSFSGLALAEPPSRAARLGYINGSVSFSPAGEPDWVRAPINRPLTTGDRLWTAEDARAEMQIGGAAIRMGASTSMTLLNLDDRITQVQLSQGTLKIRVRSFGPRQTFEVATPNLAFTLNRPGEYRIEVDPNDDATAVVVQRGEAEVYGNGASYTVDARRSYRFYGTDLSDYDVLTARRDDDLDRWSRERDRRSDGSVSARYVSSEVVGYEDLDVHGSWRVDQTYGNVWIPRRVAAGWTPYRDGHWSWIDPWGWTWVDDAPWGYAVSHYGRWAHISGAWAWVPGPRRERAVYAPALVAFVGGSNFQVSVTLGSAPAIGWFPLAPREVYQPSYPVSRVYFDSINRSNTVVAPTTITNIYNTTVVNNTTNVTNVTYANRQIAGAMVAVPAQTFVQSQPVAKATVRIAQAAAVSAPVVRVASVAPVQQSVQGGAPSAGNSKPPARERAVVARTAPPPAPVPFVVQQKELAAKPGRPIDDAQRAQLKPAAPAAVEPKVRVIATAPTPSATALPPATAPAGRSAQARKATADETGAKADATNAARTNDEAVRADAAKADKTRRDAATADAAKADASKAAAADAAARAEAAKADANKAARANEEAGRAEEAKADKAKRDAAAADAAKADANKAAAADAASARAEAAKADANRAARAKEEAGRAEEAKADNAKREAAKADAAKADAAKAEAVRADAAKAAEARADAAKAEAAKAEASKAAAGNAAAARAAADRNAADKADEARAAAAKSEANKAAAGAKDEARADKAKADQARGEAAKAEAAKAQAIQAEAARAESTKAAHARAEAAKADSARAEAARAEAAKAATAKAEHSRAEAAKADAARAEAAAAAAARAEAAKAEAAKANAAKAEATKAEAARLAQAQVPAAAPPPKARASGPKSNADVADEDEKKGGGRKP